MPVRAILKTSQLFAHLDDDSLCQIESAVTIKHVSRGEVIFHDQDPAMAFFVVGRGKVKVFKLSPDGKEQILMIASTGDSFAEAALFAGKKYPASASALLDTELLVVHRDRFVGLLSRNPDLSLNLIARLSELLRKMTILVEGLSLTDVTTRLAHHLIHMTTELPDNGELVVTLPEKKSVLASQLGTIPETLSRSLSRLGHQGVITVDGSRILIHSLEKLKSIGSQ